MLHHRRAELTAAQRSKAIKRRKEIWEALHPNFVQNLDEMRQRLQKYLVNRVLEFTKTLPALKPLATTWTR